MNRSVATMLVCVASLLNKSGQCSGYEPFAAARLVTPRVALTNVSLAVTLSLSNATVLPFRGLVFAEEMPTNFIVTPLGVTLNGSPLTNFVLEIGDESDVSPGMTPYRWILETPTNFTQANALSPGSLLQISYSLTSLSAGTFYLGDYSWSAMASVSSNGIFGTTRPFERRAVKFMRSLNEPVLAPGFDGPQSSFVIDGMPESIYVLSASTNLWDWNPLVTNLSPFYFIETNALQFQHRFFRVSEFNEVYAAVQFESTGPNTFLVSVNGVAGCAYVLECSTDLTRWSSLATNLSPFSFSHTNNEAAPGFYRARLLDPP